MTEPSSEKKESLLAMPLLSDMEFKPETVIKRLRDHWKISIRDEDINNGEQAGEATTTCVFNTGGHLVAMSLMPGPLPEGELDSLFPVSPLWGDAETETAGHRAHIVVFLSSQTGTPLERYTLFSKVLESILVETNSLGVYQGNQTLLIARDVYIDMADMLNSSDGSIPIMLWVFFGMGRSDDGNSMYTYGLSGFGKKEMEVVETQMDMDDLFDFVVSLSCYVVSNNVTFKKGETVGYTEDADATIDVSKGVFLEGETIKLKM